MPIRPSAPLAPASPSANIRQVATDMSGDWKVTSGRARRFRGLFASKTEAKSRKASSVFAQERVDKTGAENSVVVIKAMMSIIVRFIA